jgi:hypothetical protein
MINKMNNDKQNNVRGAYEEEAHGQARNVGFHAQASQGQHDLPEFGHERVDEAHRG